VNHTLLGSLSLVLATVGSALTMRMLNAIDEWSWRRALQLLVLLMPLVAVGLGLSLFHRLTWSCLFWRYSPDRDGMCHEEKWRVSSRSIRALCS